VLGPSIVGSRGSDSGPRVGNDTQDRGDHAGPGRGCGKLHTTSTTRYHATQANDFTRGAPRDGDEHRRERHSYQLGNARARWARSTPDGDLFLVANGLITRRSRSRSGQYSISGSGERQSRSPTAANVFTGDYASSAQQRHAEHTRGDVSSAARRRLGHSRGDLVLTRRAGGRKLSRSARRPRARSSAPARREHS